MITEHGLVTHRTCSICDVEKPIDDFYRQAGGRAGRMSHCIACNNRRPPTVTRIVRNRARSRAMALLVQAHEGEFARLYERQFQVARAEHEALQQAAAGNPDAEHARLRPGPVRAGETKIDRLDVARCQRCLTHHDAEHECPDCGGITPATAPAEKPWEVREWATDNGIDVPTRGPLPDRIMAAFRTARAEEMAEDPMFDESAVLRRLGGDRNVPLTRADRVEVVRRARSAGWTYRDLEQRAGVTKPERYLTPADPSGGVAS